MKFLTRSAILLLATVVSGRSGSINLGAAGGYAALGLDGASVSLSSGPLKFNGNVGVDNGILNFSSGTINGNLNHGAGATINISGGTTFLNGSENQIDFGPVNSAVQNLVTFANTQTPTVVLGSITSPMMLTGAGGQNVISVGSIHLSGGSLVLNGSASDTFIFQVSGNFELSGDTSIVLSGGLTPSSVLWDFTGTSGHVQTSGNSLTTGIFLAPDLPIQINGGVHNAEFISGVGLSFQSNPQVTPPTAAPDAGSTLLYIVLALGSLGWLKRSVFGLRLSRI